MQISEWNTWEEGARKLLEQNGLPVTDRNLKEAMGVLQTALGMRAPQASNEPRPSKADKKIDKIDLIRTVTASSILGGELPKTFMRGNHGN